MFSCRCFHSCVRTEVVYIKYLCVILLLYGFCAATGSEFQFWHPSSTLPHQTIFISMFDDAIYYYCVFYVWCEHYNMRSMLNGVVWWWWVPACMCDICWFTSTPFFSFFSILVQRKFIFTCLLLSHSMADLLGDIRRWQRWNIWVRRINNLLGVCLLAAVDIFIFQTKTNHTFNGCQNKMNNFKLS